MSTVTNTADVVIIGRVIWGLSTAWHLARQKSGQSIVVLDATRNWPTKPRVKRRARSVNCAVIR